MEIYINKLIDLYSLIPEHAPLWLFDNKNYINIIVKNNIINCKFIPKELANDCNFLYDLFISNNNKCLSSFFFYIYDILSKHSGNETFLIKILSFYPDLSKYLKDFIKSDKIIKKILLIDGSMFIYLSNAYKNNKNVILSASKNIKKNNSFAIKILSNIYSKKFIYDLPNKLLYDKEIYFNFLKINGRILNFSTPDINEKLILSVSIKTNEFLHHIYINKMNYSHHFDYMKNYSKFASLDKINIYFINYVYKKYTPEIIYNKYFCKINLKLFISMFSNYKYSEYTFYNDKNYFFELIKNFENKKDIILYLLKQNINFRKLLENKKYFIHDKDIIKILNDFNYIFKVWKLKYEEDLYKNLNFVLNKLNFLNENIKSIDVSISFNKYFVEKLLYFNLNILRRIDKRYVLKSNTINEICVLNSNLIYYLNDKNKNNIEFIKYSILKNPSNFLIFKDFIKDDKKKILELILNGCEILKYLSNDLKNDKEIIYYSVNKNASLMKYANYRFINDYIKNDFDIQKTIIL